MCLCVLGGLDRQDADALKCGILLKLLTLYLRGGVSLPGMPMDLSGSVLMAIHKIRIV